MNGSICGDLTVLGEIVMFGGILYFVNRNARVAIAIAVIAGAVGSAAGIGWITAPV